MGGHPGLRVRWLWRELGSGKLPSVKIGYTSIYVIERKQSYGNCLFRSPQYVRGGHVPSTTPGVLGMRCM